jgi:DNA-binding response OmpR family regulator
MTTDAQRILLIEDDPDNAEASRMLFQTWGYAVTVASDAESGLACAASELPDAVVLDLGLPTFEAGCALVEGIRRLPQADTILVVALTGHGSDLDRRRAIGAGCDFFFVKPANLDSLRDALATITSHREWVIRARRS